eukprot:jgi/Botrbrau1/6983/Bobra.0165s0018.1
MGKGYARRRRIKNAVSAWRERNCVEDLPPPPKDVKGKDLLPRSFRNMMKFKVKDEEWHRARKQKIGKAVRGGRDLNPRANHSSTAQSHPHVQHSGHLGRSDSPSLNRARENPSHRLAANFPQGHPNPVDPLGPVADQKRSSQEAQQGPNLGTYGMGDGSSASIPATCAGNADGSPSAAPSSAPPRTTIAVQAIRGDATQAVQGSALVMPVPSGAASGVASSGFARSGNAAASLSSPHARSGSAQASPSVVPAGADDAGAAGEAPHHTSEDSQGCLISPHARLGNAAGAADRPLTTAVEGRKRNKQGGIRARVRTGEAVELPEEADGDGEDKGKGGTRKREKGMKGPKRPEGGKLGNLASGGGKEGVGKEGGQEGRGGSGMGQLLFAVSRRVLKRREFRKKQKLKKKGRGAEAALPDLEARLLVDRAKPKFGEQALAPPQVTVKGKHWLPRERGADGERRADNGQKASGAGRLSPYPSNSGHAMSRLGNNMSRLGNNKKGAPLKGIPLVDGMASRKQSASSTARQQRYPSGSPGATEGGARDRKPFGAGTVGAVEAVAGIKRARGPEAAKRGENEGSDAGEKKKARKLVPEVVRNQVIAAYRNLVHARSAKGSKSGRVG